MPLEVIRTWYERNEKKISVGALVFGFIFDFFTLRSADQVSTTILLFSYLLITGSGILLLNILDKRVPVENKRGRIHFLTEVIVQFAIGGLFSAFSVLYFKGASFEVSFPIILVLFMGLIGNEIFKKKYSDIVFQSSIFFITLFTFLIFWIPVFFKSVKIWTFFLTDIVAICITVLFLYFLKIITKEVFIRNRKKIYILISFIFFLINIFYFLNFIPPLPLLMKEEGVFHFVVRNEDGTYLFQKEKEKLLEKIGFDKVVHIKKGDPVYVFSSIYSPSKLNTSMEHLWQKYDEDKKQWIEMSNVPIALIGGRTDGFRAYSYYFGASSGLWRVDVRTLRGQVVGRIKFKIEEVFERPQIFEEIK